MNNLNITYPLFSEIENSLDSFARLNAIELEIDRTLSQLSSEIQKTILELETFMNEHRVQY